MNEFGDTGFVMTRYRATRRRKEGLSLGFPLPPSEKELNSTSEKKALDDNSCKLIEALFVFTNGTTWDLHWRGKTRKLRDGAMILLPFKPLAVGKLVPATPDARARPVLHVARTFLTACGTATLHQGHVQLPRGLVRRMYKAGDEPGPLMRLVRELFVSRETFGGRWRPELLPKDVDEREAVDSRHTVLRALSRTVVLSDKPGKCGNTGLPAKLAGAREAVKIALEFTNTGADHGAAVGVPLVRAGSTGKLTALGSESSHDTVALPIATQLKTLRSATTCYKNALRLLQRASLELSYKPRDISDLRKKQDDIILVVEENIAVLRERVMHMRRARKATALQEQPAVPP